MFSHCGTNHNKHRDNQNDTNDSPFLVSVQRVAKVSGQYWYDDDKQGTKLCVHPKFGTWMALRAVVVFHTTAPHSKVNDDDDHHHRQCDDTNNDYTNNDDAINDNNNAPPNNSTIIRVPSAPPVCLCPVNATDIRKARAIMKHAIEMTMAASLVTDRGGDGASLEKQDALLSAYCHTAFDNNNPNNINSTNNDNDSNHSDGSKPQQLQPQFVSPSLLPWIQLRDCSSVGRDEFKYCDTQLLYYYTQDPALFRRALSGVTEFIRHPK